MGFLPLKCQYTINRLKADTPVWTVCLWIPWSPKQKQMWLIKRSSVTLVFVNYWYPGTALGERRHKVLNLSTSIMFLFSGCPTSFRGSGSLGTLCSVVFWIKSLAGWYRRRSSSCGGKCDWLPLVLSCFGAAWAKTGLTLATMAAERGLAGRPRWTVSQPSASFLPGKHEARNVCPCAFYATKPQSGDALPGFSIWEVVGWLELGTECVHLTRSAQLGPVWGSRPAASVGGGPLCKTHIVRENSQMCTWIEF